MFRALEIWSYSPWQAEQHGPGGKGFTLLFWQEAGTYRHWPCSNGFDRLVFGTTADREWTVGKLVDFARAHRCFRRAEDDDLLVEALARFHAALGRGGLSDRARLRR